MPLIEIHHKGPLKSFARLWLLLLENYFRIEVEGLENIPKKGGALITPNHSGFAGADATLLAFLIKRKTRRQPRLMAHRAFFDFSDTLKDLSQSFGLRKAGFQEGVSILKENHLMVLFPEGEAGNFKASYKRYRLEKFHTGFIRMALTADVPIVPCAVVGSEESFFNLGSIDLSKWFKNIRIPIPLNLIPLPAKWKIVFYPPVYPGEIGTKSILRDKEILEDAAQYFQKNLQSELKKLSKNRKYIYSKDFSFFKKKKRV